MNLCLKSCNFFLYLGVGRRLRFLKGNIFEIVVHISLHLNWLLYFCRLTEKDLKFPFLALLISGG